MFVIFAKTLGPCRFGEDFSFHLFSDFLLKCYKRHSAWAAHGLERRPYHETTTSEIVAWMKYYLDGDASMADYISGKTGVDSCEWVK